MRTVDTNVPKAKRTYGSNDSNPIKRLLLYAGLSREEYLSVRPDFVRSNKIMMTAVSIVVIVFMSAMTVFSFMTENQGVVSSRYVYIISLLFPFATLAIGRFGNSYSIVFVGVYLFSIFAVCGGIAMGVLGSNDNLSVSFMVIILVVPILFFGCPLRKMFFILASMIAFLIAVFVSKQEKLLREM